MALATVSITSKDQLVASSNEVGDELRRVQSQAARMVQEIGPGGEGTPEQQAHLLQLMTQLQDIEARQSQLQEVITKSAEAQNKGSIPPIEEEEEADMGDKPKKKGIIPSGGLVGFRVASDLLKQTYMEEKDKGPNPGGLWVNQ